jgi:hypothetical protein
LQLEDFLLQTLAALLKLLVSLFPVPGSLDKTREESFIQQKVTSSSAYFV